MDKNEGMAARYEREIPEGYEARIEGNKVIFEVKESEDERIRKLLLDRFHLISEMWFENIFNGYLSKEQFLAWLEKQKEQKPAGWKPQPESLEALMYAIEGKWEMIKPTSYLSRRLEDLYEGLVNSYNVNEVYLDELPRVASAGDVEALKELKRKIDASMEQKEQKPVPKFSVGDYVKDTNYRGEPLYQIVGIDKECYICEYRGDNEMGDRAVMHFTFDNPYLRLEQKPAE